MEQQARLGLEVVQTVARDFGIVGTDAAKIQIARAEAGHFWELLVARDVVPWLRVLARVHRSRRPPWRLTQLTYFVVPAGSGHTVLPAFAPSRGAAATVAWRLVKAAKLVREAEVVVRRLLPEFDGLAPEHLLHGDVVIGQPSFDRMVAGIFDLEDTLDGLRMLSFDEVAIANVALVASADEVAEQAAADLEAGSGDPSAMILAASVMTPDRGFPALAIGLSTDHVKMWGDTTVTDILGSFRNAPSGLISRISRSAGIEPTTRWQDMNVQQLSRIASALLTRIR
jgi:hypothetical protein